MYKIKYEIFLVAEVFWVHLLNLQSKKIDRQIDKDIQNILLRIFKSH